MKMCPGCECVLAFPAKLDWLTVVYGNVSRMWVCPGISCQTGLADSALWKCIQVVSLSWHFLPNWTGWQCSLKMCPECECVLAFPAKLDWLTVLYENVSSVWVYPGIFCQTGLADSALWKCVQRVSVSRHFLPNWTGWQCSLKMCSGCECVLAFSANLDWLTVLSENVSRMWVSWHFLPNWSSWALWNCVQAVSVSWHFLPNWTGWQCSMKICPVCEYILAFAAKLDWLTVHFENVSSMWVCPGICCQNWTGWQYSLKMCPGCECLLAFPAELDWLTVLSENVSRLWVYSGISCQSGLADSALWKCVQAVSGFWHFLWNWAGWQCSLKMYPGCEWVLAFPAKLD